MKYNLRSRLIKTGSMYHGFYTSRGRKFPNGNFRTSVFCGAKRCQNTDCRKNVSFSTVSEPLPQGAALLLFGTEMQKLQTFALCRIDRAALRTGEKSRFSGKLILLKYKYSRIEAIPDWPFLCFQVEFTKKICVIHKKIRKGLQVFVHPGEENESETPL